MILYFCISVISMTDKRVYKNKFLIPLALTIFLGLHTKETSDRYIIIVDNFLTQFLLSRITVCC